MECVTTFIRIWIIRLLIQFDCRLVILTCQLILLLSIRWLVVLVELRADKSLHFVLLFIVVLNVSIQVNDGSCGTVWGFATSGCVALLVLINCKALCWLRQSVWLLHNAFLEQKLLGFDRLRSQYSVFWSWMILYAVNWLIQVFLESGSCLNALVFILRLRWDWILTAFWRWWNA